MPALWLDIKFMQQFNGNVHNGHNGNGLSLQVTEMVKNEFVNMLISGV